ncbi:MAG: 50S ribosomal protein L17 [Parcubacteria group bacterium GW2011_GWA1_47_8]|nr:MAG: 50S ribosomal protein L17 [Parcubacteria group bacterium GW2011_GWA1_47_8]
MKHHKAIRKFGRDHAGREALLRSLALALIDHEHVKTTEARAKELRSFIEGLITKGRKGDLASRRLIISRLGGMSGEAGAQKIIGEIAPRYTERPGGYTRILKLPRRLGDASKMAIIEFV